MSESGGGSASGEFTQRAGERVQEVFHAIQIDYAEATQTVVYVMAGIMAVIFVVSLIRMPGGKVNPEAPPEVTGDQKAD